MLKTTSFSSLAKFEVCGRQYAYHYEEGWRPSVISANLVFGRCVDQAVSGYVVDHANGMAGQNDPEAVFRKAWQDALDSTEMEFNTTQTPQKLNETGASLAAQFPEFWDLSGLTALVDPAGRPMVQQKLTMKIAGTRYRGYLDLIALTKDGDVAIIDFKTSKIASPEPVLLAGEQLTDYQELVERNRERLGIEEVDQVGYIDLLKRNVPQKGRSGKGPEIVGPHLVPARSEAAKAERREKITHLVKQIKAGAFFRRPAMAYNTPCSMCEFRDLCMHGSEEGLVQKQGSNQKPLV